MKINFCTIASGSSGNSAFLSVDGVGILIDAGLSGVAIRAAIENLSEISAIFVTHEHSDHIKGAGVLSRRLNLPIYATEGTWSYMDYFSSIGKIAPHNRHVIAAKRAVELENMRIMPFPIPHDANEPVGYTIEIGSRKISIATDMGRICSDVAEAIMDSDILLIEANHDVDTLKYGSYPEVLKRRILSDLGHLSNVSAGLLIQQIYTKKLKHIILGHLSEENNTPQMAYSTVEGILDAAKIPINREVTLHVARKYGLTSFELTD